MWCGVEDLLGAGKAWPGVTGWVMDEGQCSQKHNWDGLVWSQSKLLVRREDWDQGKMCCGRLCGGSS